MHNDLQFYKKHGWVHLQKKISEDVVHELQTRSIKLRKWVNDKIGQPCKYGGDTHWKGVGCAGMYDTYLLDFYKSNLMIDIAKKLKPSARGEYEITDVNRAYLEAGKLLVSKLDRGMAWLDTGTHASLMQASQYVQVIEERQGLKIGCIEEIAWRMGYISDDQLKKVAEPLRKSGYGDYLLDQLSRGL